MMEHQSPVTSHQSLGLAPITNHQLLGLAPITNHQSLGLAPITNHWGWHQSPITNHQSRVVGGLVRFGGQPAVVPDEVMGALLQCEDPASGLHQENRTPFSNGDRIKLVDGPFAGMEAVFAEQDGEKRVIVLLELLGKTNKVRIDRDWVAKAA